MKNKKKNTLTSYLVITAGTMIMAAGIYLFKFPNNFSTGGVSALSMILTALFPGMTAGQYMMIINVILLVIGLLVFGKGFAVKTVYSSMLLSVCTRVFEVVMPLEHTLTEQKLLELICRNEEKLKATMTDEQKELFEKYTDCVREYQTITDCLIFQNSFKLGARMMLAVMEE